MSSFSDFGLSPAVLSALEAEGHETPTSIQSQAIPTLLGGSDLLGTAQTGSGKTAAFALPILHRLSENRSHAVPNAPRAVILAPTRELGGQIDERCRVYGQNTQLRTGLVIGGVSINRQKTMLRQGIDILVATPGRLVDLMDQKSVTMDRVETFVLDEVDQMLDLGFIHSIRRIARALPAQRQNVFFSATMPKPIETLAASLLTDPVRVDVAPERRGAITEWLRLSTQGDKPDALRAFLRQDEVSRCIVFSRTKRGADKVAKHLNEGGVNAFAIHGNRSQGQRERALEAFRSGKASVLVATDIAARGIDIPDVSHVVNYDLPMTAETYVHRIGRTARAGRNGTALSFCTPVEHDLLRAIENLKGVRLPRHEDSNEELEGVKMDRPAQKQGRKPQRRKPAVAGEKAKGPRSGAPKKKAAGSTPPRGQEKTAGAKPSRRRRRKPGKAAA